MVLIIKREKVMMKLTILHCKVVVFTLAIWYCKIGGGGKMSKRTQLLKGILDGCVLAVIEKEPVYGYELSQKLMNIGLADVSEGTIYPILLRLQKNGLIRGEMRPSESGPSRKYYFLTDKGHEELEAITREWEQISKPVNELLIGRRV